MQKVVSAEDSDIYDVLAFVAFATPHLPRAVRAAQADREATTDLNEQQRAFIAFVLEHYVREGVEQLAVEQLGSLLKLKYGSIEDARENLGPAPEIRRMFIDFQRHLYEEKHAA